MKFLVKALCIAVCLLAVPILSEAQVDPYGFPDTIYAEIVQIDDYHASITISYVNDREVVGIAVPIKMSAGLNHLVADSAIYTGGRIAEAKWSYPGFRPDTAAQCVTLGMIANIGPSDHKLLPGRGRLVTVFISSLEDKKIENLIIDTTTTAPANSLMVVLDAYAGAPADTNRLEMEQRQIVPYWVVKTSE